MTTLGPGQNSHNIQFLSQGDSYNIRFLLYNNCVDIISGWTPRKWSMGWCVPQQYSLLRTEEELDGAARGAEQARLRDDGAPGHEKEVCPRLLNIEKRLCQKPKKGSQKFAKIG